MSDMKKTFGTTVVITLLAWMLLAMPVHAVAAGAVAPADDNTHPSPFTWTNGNVQVRFEGESPSFQVSSVSNSLVNVSASVPGVGEVNPQGQLVAYAPFSGQGTQWNLSWFNVSNGLVVNLTGSPSVFATSGAWNSSELPEEGSGAGLGNAGVTLTFHLVNSGNSSTWKVKFDLTVNQWPWVSNADSMGAALSMDAEQEMELSAPGDDHNVTEHLSSNGVPVASLTWGATASVTYANGQSAVANVSANTSVSGDSYTSAVRLLFTGVHGGYSTLFYDPSIWLNQGAYAGGSSPLAWLVTPYGSAMILAGLVVAVIMAGLALKIRGKAPSTELRGVSPSCSGCGGALQVTAGSGIRILSCSQCQGKGHLLKSAFS